MADNETPAHVLLSMRDVIESAQRALASEDFREVLLQLDVMRERCSYVEKMMWRRVNNADERFDRAVSALDKLLTEQHPDVPLIVKTVLNA